MIIVAGLGFFNFKRGERGKYRPIRLRRQTGRKRTLSHASQKLRVLLSGRFSVNSLRGSEPCPK
jgi:hypothetical protein